MGTNFWKRNEPSPLHGDGFYVAGHRIRARPGLGYWIGSGLGAHAGLFECHTVYYFRRLAARAGATSRERRVITSNKAGPCSSLSGATAGFGFRAD